MSKISITQAINEAKSCIRMVKQGRQWVLVHPYYSDNIQGPSTHSQPSDYWDIRERMTNARANTALNLLGMWTWDVDTTVTETRGNLRDKFSAGLRYYREIEVPHLVWMNQAA